MLNNRNRRPKHFGYYKPFNNNKDVYNQIKHCIENKLEKKIE